MSMDEIRAEVVRQRGFIRAAETQGSKILALIDALPAEPVEPEPVEPTPEPPPTDTSGLWFHDDFSSGDTSHGENGFRWNHSSWPVEVVDGRHALAFRFPGEPRAEDHNSELRFTIAETAEQAPSEIWFEYMLRVPDNFVMRNEWQHWGQEYALLQDGGQPFTGSIDAGSNILTFDQAWVPDHRAVPRWEVDVAGADGGSEWTDIAIAERISATQVRLESAAPTTVSGAEIRMQNRSSHRSINNKFIWVAAENYNGYASEAWFIAEYAHPSPSSLGDVPNAKIKYTGSGGEGAPSKAERIHADLIRAEDAGQWVRIRIHLLAHDTDGQFELWRDDTLVMDFPAGYRTSEGEGKDYWRVGYLMGWANTGYTEDTTFHVSDFRVHATDPGWR